MGFKPIAIFLIRTLVILYKQIIFPIINQTAFIMKTLKNILLLLLIIGAGSNLAHAQAANGKNQTKEAGVKMKIDAKRYTIVANYVLPQRGGGRQLTSDYELRITPDSVISFLPYFGRAYFD